MELDKSFARENILEALQELLSRDEMVLRSQRDILLNQSVYSRPAHFKKSISKQLGDAEAVSSSQVMPLANKVLLGLPTLAIPAIESSLMGSLFRNPISYAILALFLLIIIWIIGKKIWNSWSMNPREKFINREQMVPTRPLIIIPIQLPYKYWR